MKTKKDTLYLRLKKMIPELKSGDYVCLHEAPSFIIGMHYTDIYIGDETAVILNYGMFPRTRKDHSGKFGIKDNNMLYSVCGDNVSISK